MVRLATLKDIPELIILGHEFFCASGLMEATEYDPESAAHTFKVMIENDIGVLLVIEIDGKVVGGAGAMIAPFFFNSKEKIGQEFFWFVSEKYRGTSDSLRLMNALEQAVKEKGAAFFYVAALKSGSEIVRKVYKRKGYREQETYFMRRL